jgi:hypothetical protein
MNAGLRLGLKDPTGAAHSLTTRLQHKIKALHFVHSVAPAGPRLAPLAIHDGTLEPAPSGRLGCGPGIGFGAGRGAGAMNLEKVVFGFFILLAATLNFGFVYGDLDDPTVHEPWELFAAVVVNLIAAVLKFGDRTHIGAVHLASSLVALLQLAAATVVWVIAGSDGIAPREIAAVVSLAAGALLANVVSVVIMVVETTLQRR